MAEVAGYKAGITQARASTRDFAAELDRAAKAGRLDAVADHATAMGLGLAGAFAVAVGAAAKFDKQMSEVSAVSNATGADLEKLRQAALDAGADTAFSATQAAQAEAELAKAGLETSQILGGALTGSLALAAAGSLDLAEAAEISAKTMNVFGLEGRDVTHIADVLAAAANKSATDVHEMGEAIKMGGLAANAAGMSMEETVGTLAAFADRALSGSDAGTSLKTAIMMLQAPTDKSTALMESLGIAAYDVNGNFIGTTRLAGQLQQALGGLTQEQRNAAMAQIFGADGMRAANILYELGEAGIRDYVSAVNDQGAAADVAAKKMDNLAGDVEKLMGSLETMAIEAGSGANSGLRLLTQAAGALVDEVAGLPPVVGSTATVLAGAAGGALLLGAGWVKVRRSTADMLAELRQVGPQGQRAARGLEVASKWAGRATVAFAAYEIVTAAVHATQEQLNPQIEALGEGLREFGKSGLVAGEAARVLGSDMEDLGVGLKFIADTDNTRRKFARWGQDMLEFVVPGLDGTNTSLTRTRERVEAMDQALAQLVQGGKPAEAKAAFDRLAASVADDGVSVEELRKQLPEYVAAVELAGKESSKAAGGIGKTGEAAAISAQQVQELKDAFDKLFNGYLSIDRANLKYQQGLKSLHDELTDGARTLKTNTEAGQDNVAAVLDQIEKIKDLRDARLAQGETLDVVNGKYVRDLDGLRKTLLQLGYNRAAVDDLIGKYREVPEQVQTEVSAPGAKGATSAVDGLNRSLGVVPSRKVVGIWANTSSAQAAINAVKTKVDQLRNKRIYIEGTVYWTSKGDLKVPGGTLLKNDRGGVYEHAAVGVLRDAHLATPVDGARYAYAERSTGGELFAPKYGDWDRTRALVGYAIENWWGGWSAFAPPMAVPAPPAGSGGPDAGQVAAMVAAAVRQGLTSMTVQMDGRTVGVIQGRQADLYSRGV
ncbi:phage tail tape measure protein [Micromonospora humida]|uniref:phage tail tape measure protein n=1 Tax=Micromonospora humida TaxID=2809018 RepID=UPI00366CC1E9